MHINWKAVGAGAALTLVAAACSDVASPKRNMTPHALRTVADGDGTLVTYTGQGFTNGVLNTLACVPPDNGGTGVTLTDNQPYLLWILTANDADDATLYGLPDGPHDMTQKSNGPWKVVTTPYYSSDDLVNKYHVHAQYLGTSDNPQLTVSHGCPGGTVREDAALTVVKDAAGAYDNKYAWTITKGVDKTVVKQVGGNATFNYTVNVSHDVGTISGVKVTGKITVFNSNGVAVGITGVTDKLSDNTVCAVTGGGAQPIAGASKDFAYSCDLSALPGGQLDNTATVTWNEQTLSDGSHLAAGSANFKVENIAFTGTTTDECVDVTDTFAGALGTACVGDANPKSYTYARTVPVPANDCVSYDNTATFTTNDTKATDSKSKTVKACGPLTTGALTIGFWGTTNGQTTIQTYCTPSGKTSLKDFLTQYNPYKDLTATTCAGIATYVQGIISSANASGAAMNAMLRAQMLATALDIYFSDAAMGWTSTSIGGKKAPSNFLPNSPIGGKSIDLTKICTDLTCVAYEDVSSVFGNATSLTITDIVAYAAGQASATVGALWYANVKATQELAKDTFDAINNVKAFAP